MWVENWSERVGERSGEHARATGCGLRARGLDRSHLVDVRACVVSGYVTGGLVGLAVRSTGPIPPGMCGCDPQGSSFLPAAGEPVAVGPTGSPGLGGGFFFGVGVVEDFGGDVAGGGQYSLGGVGE